MKPKIVHQSGYDFQKAKSAIKDRREQEVLDAVKRCRTLSFFWLTEPGTRFDALKRLAKRGVLSYRPMGYPWYRVVLHRANAAQPQGETK